MMNAATVARQIVDEAWNTRLAPREKITKAVEIFAEENATHIAEMVLGFVVRDHEVPQYFSNAVKAALSQV